MGAMLGLGSTIQVCADLAPLRNLCADGGKDVESKECGQGGNANKTVYSCVSYGSSADSCGTGYSGT